MERVSVNGILRPQDNNSITDEYVGHFMQVVYIQKISNQLVFAKDRVDVDASGEFRFFIPKELADNEMTTIEVYAPDGEMLGKQRYSFASLKHSNASVNVDDDSSLLEIVVNPKVITFNADSPAEVASKLIRGKVIDTSGERQAVNLQVIIMVSDDANADFNTSTYKAVIASTTDSNGYFSGKLEHNNPIEKAFGVIAGLETEAIEITLEDNKLPQNILLVTDLTNLSDDIVNANNTPVLPDSDELVNSSAFSQDLGGKCVDFTIPNRTLEEFSFYHTVRTTEPEIKGLTITPNETTTITKFLLTVSDDAFFIFNRLNASLNSLSMHTFSAAAQETKQSTKDNQNPAVAINPNLIRRGLALNFTAGNFTKPLNILGISNRFILPDFDRIKIALEQSRRQTKLSELQRKLAAAYCGKKGVSEAKTYCEQLTSQDTLNRKELSSFINHIKNNKDLLKLDVRLSRVYDNTLFELESFIKRRNTDAKRLKDIIKETDKLLKILEKNTKESKEQQILLGSIKKIIFVLGQATKDNELSFEPCPPVEQTETMGIICLMQEFDKIKQKLRNTSILSLGEIVTIEAYYRIFLKSIITFLALLDEFHTFYSTSIRFSIVLTDHYFIEEYDDIKDSLTRLARQIKIAISSIAKIKQAYVQNHPGRTNLSVERSIDWDETPTVYENTTIAHGHILHFKQKWKADGYSLGDLLYSLPLGPCQEKQIAILDWDREERGRRSESQIAADQLQADISRNRDITDIISSTLRESIDASSSNNTSSTSAGIGGGVGGFLSGIVFGVAGGVSHSGASSNSTANQNSSRNLSASSLNSLRDRTSQSASSLRSQRSTVIQQVNQNESVSAQTEVIKNNNHCHAMTIEYFEVLKHYALEEELADVQECLYVPLPMSPFDHKKIMRWRDTLRRSIYGRKLTRGFAAIERIESRYANSDLPINSYSEENIEEFTGNFSISFELRRPNIPEIDDATKTIRYNLRIDFPWWFGRDIVIPMEQEVPLTEAEKDSIFEEQFAPDIVRAFIETLDIHAIDENGGETLLDLDVTLLSNYRKGLHLTVNIASNSRQDISRRQIQHLRFRANTAVKAASKIILRSVYLHYRTKHLSEYIIRNSRVNNDIINTVSVEVELGFPPEISIETKTDAALLYTPLNNRELRNPRKEDRDAASTLVDFLNEHLEKSHKTIWSRMDESRLFGLLDGYLAPNARGKSVASVVENKIMGIVGNNLVLKVIPGERLDPVFRGVENLFEHYKPTTKPDPYRISVPTKGVYAESVMGKCNSCETIDETRHWRFEDVPCGTKPTAIDPLSTASRRSDPGNLQTKDLPTNIINLQTAPDAPDPTGLAAALALLGKGDSFNDITGLAGTQANALSALQTTSKSVTDLASISKDFAGLAVMANQKQDGAKQIEQIKKLNKDGFLTDDEAKEQIKKVLDSYTDAAKSVTKDPDEDKITENEVKEIAKTSDENKVDIVVDKKANKISTKSNRKKKRRTSKKELVVAFDIADSAALPMHGLLDADLSVLLPGATKQVLPSFFVEGGLSQETVKVNAKSGDRGKLHVVFHSAINPYEPANSSADINQNFAYKGNVSFKIPEGDSPLIFKIRLKFKEFTIISSSKEGAITAISNSEKVTKGGKIYAEAEGGIPFLTTIKGGIEVSGSLEDSNTIVDTNLQENELATSFSMKLPTGGLLISQE